MKHRIIWFLLAVGLLLVLPACGERQQPKIRTLIYANLTEDGVNRAAVEAFNQNHEDIRIEVRDYFDEDGFSGKQRLLTEIAAGNIPDIIDLGRKSSLEYLLPYKLLAKKGFLEDLWPYIENDSDLGRESLLEAPLKAAEVDGGLYVAFNRVAIHTLAGREDIVGNRYGWTLDDLQEAFSTMPEESSILPFYTTKSSAFFDMFSASLDKYVNWETGACSFDSEGFRSDLVFVNSFPDDVEIDTVLPRESLSDEMFARMYHGQQMLFDPFINTPHDIQLLDRCFGQESISLVGYPTSDGKPGSYFVVYGNTLAISSTCQDKEAAWEFLRRLFLPQYANDYVYKNNRGQGFPINLSDYDRMKRYVTGRMEGVTFSKDPADFPHRATEEQVKRFEDLINHVNRIALGDKEIYNIVYEVTSAYFAGDLTLDQAVDRIQNRVSLYVNESR